jgi:hypothetical protein
VIYLVNGAYQILHHTAEMVRGNISSTGEMTQNVRKQIVNRVVACSKEPKSTNNVRFDHPHEV